MVHPSPQPQPLLVRNQRNFKMSFRCHFLRFNFTSWMPAYFLITKSLFQSRVNNSWSHPAKYELKTSCKRCKGMQMRHVLATPAAPTGDWQDGLCHRWDQNISARMFFDGHSQTVHFMPCRIAFYLGKSRLIMWKTWRHFRSTTGSSCQRLWNHAMYSALAWRHQTGTAQMPESFLTLLRR